jgi:2,3-bisphosphoglycerate-dependent phosphoglycerate mutase
MTQMKPLRGVLTIAFLVLLASVAVPAQKKTIILVRHAEKDPSAAATNPDPELSPVGQARAMRLIKKIGKYRPQAIYSTSYKRTTLTVKPLADKRHLAIQTYDPADQPALADQIIRSKAKRIVVSGHSNTIPALANLLSKKELFKSLAESEFTVIWIIRLRNGTFERMQIVDY